jgi:four helix bundle protein
MSFTHCRLPAYIESVKFVDWALHYLKPAFKGSLAPNLADQLARASTSISLNIAEGSGRWHKKDKSHFYQIAMGSTSECAAILELASVCEAVSKDDADVERAMIHLNQIAALLVTLMDGVKGRES